jgi:hypothetical protein
MKKKLLGMLALLLLGGLGGSLLKGQKHPPCIRMEAKLELANEFCDGLALRAANERCSQVSEDPDVMGQCMRVIVPAAHSSCMSYLNLERLKQQYASLCEE